MYNVSEQYKEQMKSPIRNPSYMRVSLGVINQEAQMTAEVADQSKYTGYSDFNSVFTQNDVGNIYATYEKDFFPADGSMYFLPRDSSKYRKNGITLNNLFSGNDYIKFVFGYGESDIRGLTIQFGGAYPTKFTVTTESGAQTSFENDSSYFTTDTVFYNTSSLTLRITEMSVPNNRVRIMYIKFGIGVEYDNEIITSAESSSSVSLIDEELPAQSFSVTLENTGQRFNVDNPSSEINFLETGQNISVIYGYELDDRSVEWMKLHTLYVSDWSADDSTAVIQGVDRFQYMTENYYKGRYYSSGITLYDLAEDVLSDAGIDEGEYILDPYLRKVTVYNPLPNVTHKEALQIIANAGRCTLDYDRYGRIRMKYADDPEYVTSSNGTTYFSDVTSIDKSTNKRVYAMYSENYWTADGNMYFVPRSGVQGTGYVSSQISGLDGTFTENPVITRKLNSEYTCYGILIKFGGTLPRKFKISTYSGSTLTDTLVVSDEISETMNIVHDFVEFDKIEVEFTETEPNNRIQVLYMSLGDETDYTITYDDMMSTPTGTQLEKVRRLNVSRYRYSNGSTDEELTTDTFEYNGENQIYYFTEPCYGFSAKITEGSGSISVVNSGAYYVELSFSNVKNGSQLSISVTGRKYNVSESIYTVSVNNRGTDSAWQNPLISDANHCKSIASWVADYMKSGVEYEIDFRGDPAIDCGDTIFQESKYINELKTVVEEHQMSFDGTISGVLRTRRKEHVDAT